MCHPKEQYPQRFCSKQLRRYVLLVERKPPVVFCWLSICAAPCGGVHVQPESTESQVDSVYIIGMKVFGSFSLREPASAVCI